MTSQNLLGISQQHPAITQTLDILDGLLDFAFVLTGIELTVEGVFDDQVQKRVSGDIENGGFGVCQVGEGIDAGFEEEGGGRDGKNDQRSQDGGKRQFGQRRRGRGFLPGGSDEVDGRSRGGSGGDGLRPGATDQRASQTGGFHSVGMNMKEYRRQGVEIEIEYS